MIIDIEELKQFLEINNTDDDAILKVVAESAIDYAENYCNNTLVKPEADIEEIVGCDELLDDGTIYFGSNQAVVLTNVYKNTGDDYSVNWELLTSDDYIPFSDRIILRDYPSYENSIKIDYSAGYDKDDIPGSLKIALFNLIGNFWNKRLSGAVSNESLGDANITWKMIMNTETQALFKKYKNHEVYI